MENKLELELELVLLKRIKFWCALMHKSPLNSLHYKYLPMGMQCCV